MIRKGITINFNNVRRNACIAYDKLVNELNACKEHEGYMLVDPHDIQDKMDSLRQMIGAIAMTYEEDNENFKDVFEELYPESEGKSMHTFDWNSEEE